MILDVSTSFPVRYVFWVKGEGNNKLQELGDFYSMSEVHDGLRYLLLPWNGPCEKCQPQGGGRYTSVWRICPQFLLVLVTFISSAGRYRKALTLAEDWFSSPLLGKNCKLLF